MIVAADVSRLTFPSVDFNCENIAIIGADLHLLLQLVQFFHLRLHAFIHFDERRPLTFEPFPRQFLRRVDAGLAADGDFAGAGHDCVQPAMGFFHLSPRKREKSASVEYSTQLCSTASAARWA